MALKDVIKETRIKKNLKQEEAAKMIGVTVQTYSKWENGKTEPKASQVAKLSKILGISTHSICFGRNSRKLEFMSFMRMISEQSNMLSDFELNHVIWNTIEDDFEFFENLDKYNEKEEESLNDIYRKQLENEKIQKRSD